MFMQPPLQANHNHISRPIILGLVLLFLFMTLQNDWSSGHGGSIRSKGEARGSQGSDSALPIDDDHKDTVSSVFSNPLKRNAFPLSM